MVGRLCHRWHVTDDRGYHCPRSKLDTASGCCTKGERYSCQTCAHPDRLHISGFTACIAYCQDGGGGGECMRTIMGGGGGGGRGGVHSGVRRVHMVMPCLIHAWNMPYRHQMRVLFVTLP